MSGSSSVADTRRVLLEAKLSQPRIRPGTVKRPRLTDVLVSSAACPLVVISAPVGFGKATLLADWAERDNRTFAWVSLDHGDNDPVTLLTAIVTAVGRVRAIDDGLLKDLASPGISILGRVVPRLVASLQSPAEPFVLVLRNIEAVKSRASRDAIDLVVDLLPPGVQVALSSRQLVWLATAGRRSRRDVLELGPVDLAFNSHEAAQLLSAAGVSVGSDEVERLTKFTEGWAAGLYLSALALRAGRWSVPQDTAAPLHPFLSDYLRSEVLSHLPRDAVRFLRETAVLDMMSGSLCDAVLETTGSERLLHSLARSNLFVVPLDDQQEWYRYHSLFRSALLDELLRKDPGSVAALHERAADWWEANGEIDQAIRHAQAVGDSDRAARLLIAQITPAYNAGHLPVIDRALAALGDTTVEQHPMLAVLAGWVAALTGRAVDAARWAEFVEHLAQPASPPDRAPSFVSTRAMLRAFVCAHGVAVMATDAELAVALEPAWSPWRAVAAGLLGIARSMEGDLDAAEVHFAEGIEAAEATGAWVPLARVLGHRALLSMDRGDWTRAAADVDRAKAVVKKAGLGEYGATAVARAAAARLLMHRNEIALARAELLHAMRLRVLVTWASPWFAVGLRLEMANTHLALNDPGGALILLREIDEVLHHRPQLGLLNDRVEGLRKQLANGRAIPASSTLTTAELRLLPYLQTHLTFGEIAERLYVSRNTVATQSASLYRKLGVSSRGQAVDRACELGLLAARTPA